MNSKNEKAGPNAPMEPDFRKKLSDLQVPSISLSIKEIPAANEEPERSAKGKKRINLYGELVKNSNFEQWTSAEGLDSWEGSNFIKTEDALTDNFAVRLGNNLQGVSQLFQDIAIIPNQFLELKFSLKMSQSLLEHPTVKVLWLDENRELLDSGLEMRISKIKKDYYNRYSRITSKSPAKTAYARLLFEKNGYGSFLIDEISVRCY